jgi:hypothetical protein
MEPSRSLDHVLFFFIGFFLKTLIIFVGTFLIDIATLEVVDTFSP